MVGYVAMGSNLGDRQAQLRHGVDALAAAGVEPLALSSVWETEPVGAPGTPWFLNMVLKCETDLAPLELLILLEEIERSAGRTSKATNAPRTLDLDLLLFGDERRSDARLKLPHPRMWERRFVLEPLFGGRPRPAQSGQRKDGRRGARPAAGAAGGHPDRAACSRSIGDLIIAPGTGVWGQEFLRP